VRWSHNGEVSVVQGRERRLPPTFSPTAMIEASTNPMPGRRRSRSVQVVVRDEIDGVETIARDKSDEARLGTWPEPIFDRPRRLRNNRSDDREVSPRTEQGSARLMIRFVPITGSDEDAGVDEEHARSDAACELLLSSGATGAVDVERFRITRRTDADEGFEWIVVEFGDEAIDKNLRVDTAPLCRCVELRSKFGSTDRHGAIVRLR